MERNEEMAEIGRKWKAPRELTRSLPRDVRLTKGGVAISVLAGAFLIGSVVAAVGLGSKAAKDSADRRLLDAQGVEAEAVVTRLWRRSDKEHAPMVAYEFTYRGGVYRHSTRAPQRVWRTLAEGTPVKVRFAPEHPENNTPVDWKGDGPLPAFVPVLAFGILLFGGVVLSTILRSQKRLLSDGKAAPGIVRKSRRSSHGKHVYTYEFTLPGGQTVTRKSGPVHKSVEPGSIVTVLYDPEKPSRSAIYPLELVRVDEMS